MKSTNNGLLILNVGSSGVKFACYGTSPALVKTLYGEIKNKSAASAVLRFHNSAGRSDTVVFHLQEGNHINTHLLDWLQQQPELEQLSAIVHRIVYGMERTQPERITDQLLQELKAISAYDPDHMPQGIALAELCRRRFPQRQHIACFDSAFHTTMPAVAKRLPIAREYYGRGIHRYGFHGLSYAYLVQKLQQIAGPGVASGRLILAHLGNGASVAAVLNGKSMDTSMGFTPASGLPMSTRAGDIDPGLAWYLMECEKLSPEEYKNMVNHASGLLGISGTTGDMQKLLEAEATDANAAEAVEFFCYHVRKYIGAYTAVLQGLDVLVFSGGIGQHAPQLRAAICGPLKYLGVQLDYEKNNDNELLVSAANSSVAVCVIPTDEEHIMAEMALALLTDTHKN